MHSKVAMLLVALALVGAQFQHQTQANQPSYSDCMKNPFASNCRGISAKRSTLFAADSEKELAGSGRRQVNIDELIMTLLRLSEPSDLQPAESLPLPPTGESGELLARFNQLKGRFRRHLELV